MKILPLAAFALSGCLTAEAPRETRMSTASRGGSTMAGSVLVARSVTEERREFMSAIVKSNLLERDLQPLLRNTPFQIPYFSMGKIAAEAFFIVSQNPENRDHWIALSKVCAAGDGEYARIYNHYEAMAREQFPAVFFEACPDWDELVLHAGKEPVKNSGIR